MLSKAKERKNKRVMREKNMEVVKEKVVEETGAGDGAGSQKKKETVDH